MGRSDHTDSGRRAWRALAVFWGLALAAAGGTALTLEILGPPPAPAVSPQPRPQAAVPAPPPSPPVPDTAAAEAPPPGGAGEPEQPAAAQPAPPPAYRAPPEAPPPPPLPSALPAGRRGPTVPPPDDALLEPSEHGPLPRIGDDGREARQAYAAALPEAAASGARPRIALVIGGFGPSSARSEDAIRRLPGGVTLAFNPLAGRPDALLEQARRHGLEVLLALPLDSVGAVSPDHLLRASLSWPENEARLNRILGRFAGYVGAVGTMGAQRGERFAADAAQLRRLQAALRRRGLAYLDPRPGAPAPEAAWGAVVDQVLDEPLTGGEVQYRLETLEAIARTKGSAIGLAGEPSPLLVERIAGWAAGLTGRGAVLVPLSAVLLPPSDPGDGRGLPDNEPENR